jgi:hypothetical protein
MCILSGILFMLSVFRNHVYPVQYPVHHSAISGTDCKGTAVMLSASG